MAIRANWRTIKKVPVRDSVTRRVFSGKKCMLSLNELPAGSQPNMHKHPHEQLTYIIEGTCKFTLGDEVFTMSDGDLVLIPPGVMHGLEVTGKKTVLNLDAFSPIREDFLV